MTALKSNLFQQEKRVYTPNQSQKLNCKIEKKNRKVSLPAKRENKQTEFLLE